MFWIQTRSTLYFRDERQPGKARHWRRLKLSIGSTLLGRTGEPRLGYEGRYQHLSPQVGKTSEPPTVSGTTRDTTFDSLDEPLNSAEGESIKFYTKYFNANPPEFLRRIGPVS